MAKQQYTYFSLPSEIPTNTELRAIRRGETAFKKGDYTTLNDYFRAVGNPNRRTRKKVS
jgi:hypothetical protein